MAHHYYKPSGKVSLVSILYFILATLIAFPLLGAIYSYAIWYIPFIYINMFITAGLGIAVGFVISRVVVEYGKVRNGKIAALFGFLGAIAALYFHWAIWVDLVINAGESYGSNRAGFTVSNMVVEQVISLILQPAYLFSLIGEINNVGTWGIRGATVSGFFLSVIWIIEALIVLVIPVVMAYSSSKKPFCEVGNTWFKEDDLPALDFIVESEAIVTSLQNDDTQIIETLKRSENKAKQNHSIFTLYHSENSEYYLTVNNKVAKVNDKGETSFDDTWLVQHIAVNRNVVDVLLAK